MNYPKPNKSKRNAAFLANSQPNGFTLNIEPYLENKAKTAKQFLIICEGENTEKEYFDAFRVVGNVVIEIKGGFSGGKTYLVKAANKLAQQKEYTDYEVWCVFDFDVKYDNPKQKEDYEKAIKRAQENNFKVAFSNDAFELWFVLHHNLIQNQHHRQEYFDMLTEIWKLEHSYETMGKKLEFCKKHYEKLLPYQAKAIKHARKLHSLVNDGRPYHQMNPCTTVYLLVQELNKYIRR